MPFANEDQQLYLRICNGCANFTEQEIEKAILFCIKGYTSSVPGYALVSKDNVQDWSGMIRNMFQGLQAEIHRLKKEND